MASLSDLKRGWLIRALGLSSSTSSEADLEAELYAQVNGVAENRQFKSGRYYSPNYNNTFATGATTLEQLRCVPFVVGRTTTFDRIAIEVTTAGAGGTVRLGIYSDTDGIPGEVVLDAGTVVTSALGVKEIIIDQELSPGLYWLAAVPQNGVAPSIYCVTAAGNFYVGHTSFPGANSFSHYSLAGVVGALTDNPAVIATGGAVSPRICLRAV
jgi:hypothetical protein